MVYCCPYCNFKAEFQSGLKMHQELYHPNEAPLSPVPNVKIVKNDVSVERANTLPRMASYDGLPKVSKLNRTSSATKFLDKIKAKITKSKSGLYAHPEEAMTKNVNFSDKISTSPSRAMSYTEGVPHYALKKSQIEVIHDNVEYYGCHLCDFVADRITVLDRHLLNDHKIGLDTLLKLVMAKTKERINDEHDTSNTKSYYKEERIDEPKKATTASNTELHWFEITVKSEEDEIVVSKMEMLNECICKFAESSMALKDMLGKELQKPKYFRDYPSNLEDHYDLRAEDTSSTPTQNKWEKTSEKSSGRRCCGESSKTCDYYP